MIYIAGKITGEEINLCKKKFTDYLNVVVPFAYIKRNPLGYYFAHNGNELHTGKTQATHGFLINHDLIPHGTWQKYMRNDLAVLLQCEEAHFLPCWKDSEGAKLEHMLCEKLGIKIIYV